MIQQNILFKLIDNCCSSHDTCCTYFPRRRHSSLEWTVLAFTSGTWCTSTKVNREYGIISQLLRSVSELLSQNTQPFQLNYPLTWEDIIVYSFTFVVCLLLLLLSVWQPCPYAMHLTNVLRICRPTSRRHRCFETINHRRSNMQLKSTWKEYCHLSDVDVSP